MIVRHENHPMGTEATLIYNLWIFSYLINLIRRLTGIIWGFTGRVIYLTLDTFDKQVRYSRTISISHIAHHPQI